MSNIRSVTVQYIDTCSVSYLLDHLHGENQRLVSVDYDPMLTHDELVEELLDNFSICIIDPKPEFDGMMLEQAALATVQELNFSDIADQVVSKNDEPDLDFDYLPISYWFLISWEM